MTPARNKGVPTIQTPLANPLSLQQTVQQLKQGMESLAGTRGNPTGRAVTFDDLVSLGLVAGVKQATVTTVGSTANSSGSEGSSGSTTAVVNPYVLTAFLPALPSGVCFGHQFPVGVQFPASFAPISTGLASEAGAFVAPTGSSAITIQTCAASADPTSDGSWATVGQISFTGGVGTLSSSGNLNCPAGSRMRWLTPDPADATLAQVFVTLVGTR